MKTKECPRCKRNTPRETEWLNFGDRIIPTAWVCDRCGFEFSKLVEIMFEAEDIEFISEIDFDWDD